MKNFITGVSNFIKQPLLIGWFLLVLTIVFSLGLLKIIHGSDFLAFITGTVSTVFGGVVAYAGLMVLETKKTNMAALNIVNVIVRCLGHQYLQLVNIEKNLEQRQLLLGQPGAKENLKDISQDFREDLYRVDLALLCSLPLSRVECNKFEEVLQDVFMCDRAYFNVMDSVLQLNDIKKELLKPGSDASEFFLCIGRRFPERLDGVRKVMQQNKDTYDKFQDAIKATIYGKNFKKRQYGEIYLKNNH